MDGRNGNRKAVLLVLVVFALGIALGGVGVYLVTARVQANARIPANHMAMFTRDLNLTPEQQKQIQAIIGDTRARYTDLHDKFDPEYERVRHEGRQRIRETLTPEQRPKFEDLLRQIDEERKQRLVEQGR
jgi:Spy/CpxP family protein refolding chaperone